MRDSAFLLFFLWAIFWMDVHGFPAAMASEGDMERTEQFGPCRRESDPIANTAHANHRSWNVYLEWNGPGCSSRPIVKEMRTTEGPKISSALARGYRQGMESEGRYTLLKEGEETLSDPSQKECSERQRDWKGIERDTAFFMGYQVVIAGILYFMPESVSNWTSDQKKATVNKWSHNASNPAWDHDKLWINYIGHPFWGATYYIRARERGFGEFGSFGYSALLSALYEFGIEALFEHPSYQDLIVTPVGGTLIGKFIFEPIREYIKAKARLKWYDHVGLILTDPLGASNSIFERAFGIQSDIRVQFHSSCGEQMAAPNASGSPEWREVRFSRPDGVSIHLQAEWK